MSLKNKCLELKEKNPKWGYGTISKALGCAKSTAEYHLKPSGKKVHRTRVIRNRAEKRNAIKMLGGGKCIRCQYDKCLGALHFHHLPEFEKVENIGRMVRRHGMDSIRNEVKKCILICANCHAELHEGLWTP